MDLLHLNSSAEMATGKNHTLVEYWDFLFTDLADPRTNDWPLIGSPLPGLTILGIYLYFVLSWGPNFMANRKPYNLNNLLILYNALQVVLSTYMFYECLDIVRTTKYNFRCEPVNWERTPETRRITRAFYMYFLAKLTELLDTVFFVLRKKQNQVSFLHIYHHTTMPMISWGATKYYPGGHGSFVGMVNTFVHIIMYTYYMLAAVGPKVHKYLWWKKYITTIQMVQFGLTFIHSMQLLFIECDYPWWSCFFVMPNSIFLSLLFYNFYKKAYKPGDKKKDNKHGTLVNGEVCKQMNGADFQHTNGEAKKVQ